ncbi:MAG: DUF4389 domain-containing protein [Proteobacteria bacterium]|nr:DUF4389 domain-containing protein [Pseudomonadota bacterium]
MSEELDELVANLKEASAWIRVLFMLAFAIVLYLIIAPIILVLMIVQALFVIITGESNSNLRFLGAALSKYIFQVLQFLSYNSNTKPFPFSDFPEVKNDEFNPAPTAKSANKAAAEPARKAPAKQAVRKTAAKKAAPKKSKSTNSETASDGGLPRTDSTPSEQT